MRASLAEAARVSFGEIDAGQGECFFVLEVYREKGLAKLLSPPSLHVKSIIKLEAISLL